MVQYAVICRCVLVGLEAMHPIYEFNKDWHNAT